MHPVWASFLSPSHFPTSPLRLPWLTSLKLYTQPLGSGSASKTHLFANSFLSATTQAENSEGMSPPIFNEVVWIEARKTDGTSDYNWFFLGTAWKKLIWAERKFQQQKELGRLWHLGFHISVSRADVAIAEIQSNHHLHYNNGADFT